MSFINAIEWAENKKRIISDQKFGNWYKKNDGSLFLVAINNKKNVSLHEK